MKRRRSEARNKACNEANNSESLMKQCLQKRNKSKKQQSSEEREVKQ